MKEHFHRGTLLSPVLSLSFGNSVFIAERIGLILISRKFLLTFDFH